MHCHIFFIFKPPQIVIEPGGWPARSVSYDHFTGEDYPAKVMKEIRALSPRPDAVIMHSPKMDLDPETQAGRFGDSAVMRLAKDLQREGSRFW